ncbi:hypothetical protein ES695_06630 [Candidatus Atribacteria bacterium 1244-E10-H5-B2]|nr:MAG: hypothetical protein ES695_06630 [Candidatus Atribacteria bacterium 1244-E10-H5-B2]
MDPKDFEKGFIDKYKGMNPEDINIEDLFNGKFGNMFKDFLGMKGGKRGMQKNSLALIEQVQKIIDSYDFALTLRQIYYQLVAKQIIPNLQKYYRKLSRICVAGRDEGLLSEEGFADRLREVDKPGAWLNLSEFMQTVKRSYNKDKWQNQPKYLEIWTEKDALRSVLTEITYRYDVSLMVARGQLSRTAVYEASNRYKAKSDKKCYLYYCGDFDPSGLSIYNSIKERLEAFGIFIHYERIALTKGQIEKYKLPSDPAKQSDPNYNKFVSIYGSDMVVELDSLPPDILRDIIKDCITKNIDSGLLVQVQEKETEEQDKLNKFINKR